MLLVQVITLVAAQEQTPPMAHEQKTSMAQHHLRAWNSPKCAHFYDNESDKIGAAKIRRPSPTGLERMHLPQYRAHEDICPNGRSHRDDGSIGQEVLLVPSLRVAYIDVRKCASETIRGALAHTFGATVHRCGDRLVDESCGLFMPSRCGVGCLQSWEVQNYFFFTFVRHPISRFYSSFFQAYPRMPELKRFGGDPYGIHTSMQTVLSHKLATGCTPDEHLESMTMSLSPLLANGARLPLDYIGDIETLEHDLFEMIELAFKTHNLSMIEIERLNPRLHILRQGLRGKHDHNRASSGLNEMIERVRAHDTNKTLDNLVRAVYEQDMVCFGFDTWNDTH